MEEDGDIGQTLQEWLVGRDKVARDKLKPAESELELLTAGLTRNVLLLTLLTISIHTAGARAVPNAGADEKTVDIVWLALMSGAAGVVAIGGIQLQVNAYVRSHREAGVAMNTTWLLAVYVVMISLVLLFAILYPILFVLVDN